jgi:ABC-2 type transport system ATP-binding protein
MNAIHVEGLTKSYGDKEVLKGVSLDILEGEFYALMGPNGSGKTTLISILASTLLPTSGKVEICGRRPQQARELVGYVPQSNFTIPNLTGRENLIFFARILGHSKSEAAKLARDLLEKIGLSEDADKRVSAYSGGMRKRLEAATALFPGIKVMLLDEPTTGLDPSARRRFFGLIQDLKGETASILLITHLGSDAELASRVGLIDGGRMIGQGAPEVLKDQSGLSNVISIETAAKSDKAVGVLKEFSEDARVLETDVGYRVYSRDYERATPEIVRALDQAGAKVLKVESTAPSLEDVFFKMTGRAVSELD